MPSFSESVGVIVTLVALATASGHGALVWRAIGEVRRVALTSARQDWGCPSLSGQSVCKNYDFSRYH